MWVLALERIREPHASEARLTVALVDCRGGAQLGAQLISTHVGQKRRAILAALAAPHDEQSLIEVDVFDA